MDNELLTRPQIREKGMSILQKELGITGFIEFMQEFGLTFGNYTKERSQWLTEKTVDEIVENIKKTGHL